MKKMTIIIIALAVVILVLIYGFKLPIKDKFRRNLIFIRYHFGDEIAQNIERIYRLETNHFRSGQFKGTFAPGMEKFGEKYPYGWKTMASIFWDNYPFHRPIGFWTGTEGGTGKQKTFLKFPSLKSAMLTLAYFLRYYGNNPGRWYSLNSESQKRYNDNIYKFKTPIYDSIA